MEWLWILLGLLVLFVDAVVVMTAVLFRFAIGRPKPVTEEQIKRLKTTVWHKYYDKSAPVIKRMRERESRLLTATAYDGVTLHATLIPCLQPTDRVAVLVHGWHGNRYWDFGMALEHYADDERCHLIMIEQRAHDDSPCRYTGFGLYERHDVVTWANEAVRLFGEDCKILLSGVSMGARTVLLSSGLDLPRQVKGITADCGPSSAWDEFKYVLHSYHLPAFPFLPLADLFCKVNAGYGFKMGDTVETVRHARVPILFIHGKNDNFVPCEMTLKNYEACTSAKRLVIVEHAGHGASYAVEPERVCREMSEFLKEIGF